MALLIIMFWAPITVLVVYILSHRPPELYIPRMETRPSNIRRSPHALPFPRGVMLSAMTAAHAEASNEIALKKLFGGWVDEDLVLLQDPAKKAD